jgi:Ni/Fe-hydrogenase subunit HybB-like protein
MKARSTGSFAACLVVLLGLVALGAYAFAEQLTRGDVATGMRSIGAGGAAWGLYIAMDGFFLSLGVSAMAGACIARFSRDRDLEAVARIAMPVAIACSLGAALSVLVDQGRPLWALRNLMFFARTESPLFVTFSTVGAVCLYGSLVHCVLARRPDLAEYAKRPSPWQKLQRLVAAGYVGSPGERYRRRKAGFWMSLFMLPALLAPLTALAIVLTARLGRPLALSLIEVITFMLSSIAGGLALIAGAAALVRRWTGPDAGLSLHGTARVARGLLVTVSLVALSVVAAAIVGVESEEAAAASSARALIGESYGSLFWGQLAMLLCAAVLLWRAVRRPRVRHRSIGVAALLALVAIFVQRYLVLVVWQTHGHSLPYPTGTYHPSWVELSVALGIVALCAILLLPAVRLIPFAPCVVDRAPVPAKIRDGWRALLTGIWAFGGLGISAVGWALSNRAGTLPYLDPRIQASPAIFVAGLVWLATTGAVYELLPDRKAKRVAVRSESASASPHPMG